MQLVVTIWMLDCKKVFYLFHFFVNLVKKINAIQFISFQLNLLLQGHKYLRKKIIANNSSYSKMCPFIKEKPLCLKVLLTFLILLQNANHYLKLFRKEECTINLIFIVSYLTVADFSLWRYFSLFLDHIEIVKYFSVLWRIGLCLYSNYYSKSNSINF